MKLYRIISVLPLASLPLSLYIYVLHGIPHRFTYYGINLSDISRSELVSLNSGVYAVRDKAFGSKSPKILFYGNSFARDFYNILTRAYPLCMHNFSYIVNKAPFERNHHLFERRLDLIRQADLIILGSISKREIKNFATIYSLRRPNTPILVDHTRTLAGTYLERFGSLRMSVLNSLPQSIQLRSN